MRHWSILGSGVTALCAATALEAVGEKIELIEYPQKIAASHWAGGMLAPYCEAEAAPPKVTEKSLFSIAWWKNHSSYVQHHGTLVVAAGRDQAELQRFATRTQQHQQVQPVQLEADLAHFKQALFFPTEAHLDPRLALAELKQKLIEKNVPIHQGQASGQIIDCRGFSAQTDLAQLRAVRGEMLILNNPYVHFKRPIRLLHPRFACYLVPRRQQQFMLGATMLETQDAGPISVRSLMELLNAAYSIHPSFADAKVIETGVGLRPAYADNIPKLIYQNQTIYLNGMHRHGFLFGPVLATQLLQYIEGKNT